MKQTMMHYGGSFKPDASVDFENMIDTIEIQEFENGNCGYPSSN